MKQHSPCQLSPSGAGSWGLGDPGRGSPAYPVPPAAGSLPPAAERPGSAQRCQRCPALPGPGRQEPCSVAGHQLFQPLCRALPNGLRCCTARQPITAAAVTSWQPALSLLPFSLSRSSLHIPILLLSLLSLHSLPSPLIPLPLPLSLPSPPTLPSPPAPFSLPLSLPSPLSPNFFLPTPLSLPSPLPAFSLPSPCPPSPLAPSPLPSLPSRPLPPALSLLPHHPLPPPLSLPPISPCPLPSPGPAGDQAAPAPRPLQWRHLAAAAALQRVPAGRGGGARGALRGLGRHPSGTLRDRGAQGGTGAQAEPPRGAQRPSASPRCPPQLPQRVH